jgi:MFS family permease
MTINPPSHTITIAGRWRCLSGVTYPLPRPTPSRGARSHPERPALTKLVRSMCMQTVKGAILSSFYYGYATSQIPCAWFASKFGGVRMLAASMTLSTLAALSTPSDATQFVRLCCCRAAVGVAQVSHHAPSQCKLSILPTRHW